MIEVGAYSFSILFLLDLLGTFVFALSGAVAGVKAKLDLFGLLALSFGAGCAGGVTRDLLIGSVPPAAISDWRYLLATLAAGLMVFYWNPSFDVRRKPVLLLDGAGLALFAVTGTQKALAVGLHPVMAALMGMLTGVGGGIFRDLLVNQTPTVLKSDLYAVAALAAGLVVIAGDAAGAPPALGMIAGALFCFWLRVMAIRKGWRLPSAS